MLTGIGKVKDAFAAGTLSLSTIGWVTGALALVASVGAIVGLTQAHLSEIYKDSNNLNTAMSNLGNEMITIESTYQSSMANIESTSKLAEDYVTQLEALEAAGVKTTEQQKQYTAIVQKLKALIPSLNISIDEQTGLIVGGTKAIREQTSAWKEQAVLEIMMRKQKAQIEALTDAQIALTEAETAQKNNIDSLKQKRQELTAIEEQFAAATGKTMAEFKSMSQGEVQAFYQAHGQAAADLVIKWNNLQNAARELEMAQSALDTAVQNGTASVAAANAEVQRTQEVYQQAYDAMANTEAATAGTDAVTNALEGVGTAADSAAKDVRDFSSDVSDMTKNLKEESDITLKEATKNLQENTKLYNNLWSNIGNLMKRGVSQDFLYHLQQMGPEGWKIIDEMNKSSDKKLKEFLGIVGTNAEASKQTWETEIGAIPGITKDAMTDAESEARTGGKNVGTAMGEGVESGVSATTASIATQASNTVKAAIRAAKKAAEIASPSKKMKNEVGKP